MKTLNGTVGALVVLSKSPRPITPQAIDRVVDPYLINVGKLTNEVRGELGEAFIKKAPPSERSKNKFTTVFCFRIYNQCTALIRVCHLFPMLRDHTGAGVDRTPDFGVIIDIS